MSFLAEIQAAALDPSVSVADFLRRCQILAARLRHEPFKTWVTHELSGYPDDAELPPYRKDLAGEVRAQLAGPFGSRINNSPVPLSFLSDDAAQRVRSFEFFQGVGMLEAMVADAQATGNRILHSPFAVELYAQMEIVHGYATVGMWKELPIHAVSNILDQVRSRALAFTLDIEAENPAAGDVMGPAPPVSQSRADAIFTTTIYGGSVAVGPGATVQVVQGDRESLMAYLGAHGVDHAEQSELAAAINADGSEPGNHVASWLGRVSLRLAASGALVMEGAGGALLATAIARYFGL